MANWDVQIVVAEWTSLLAKALFGGCADEIAVAGPVETALPDQGDGEPGDLYDFKERQEPDYRVDRTGIGRSTRVGNLLRTNIRKISPALRRKRDPYHTRKAERRHKGELSSKPHVA